jgi:hypothetical protein
LYRLHLYHYFEAEQKCIGYIVIVTEAAKKCIGSIVTVTEADEKNISYIVTVCVGAAAMGVAATEATATGEAATIAVNK